MESDEQTTSLLNMFDRSNYSQKPTLQTYTRKLNVQSDGGVSGTVGVWRALYKNNAHTENIGSFSH
jgi:hypothetical protein